MIKFLEVKNKDGNIMTVRLKELDLDYVDKIMELEETIYSGLEDKRLYAPSGKEDFVECIKSNGKIIGCITDDNELIAMGVYKKNRYNNHNYGYDLEIEGEELLKVGQIESTVVKIEYRGNKLQKIICEILEEIAKLDGMKILASTASPYNEFSVNTFKSLGYEIKKDKIKYGGLRRFILAKELK